MNWIHRLYETYENCQSVIGKVSGENEVPLLPICHTTQKAQIEITLDGSGNFLRAGVIRKENARTIIPCTESSGGRTSGESAHPLCDKLQYIAKDYKEYTGEEDSYFDSYIDQLKKWAQFDDTNIKIKAVLSYIERGNVIKDLIDYCILHVNNEKKLFFTSIEQDVVDDFIKNNQLDKDFQMRILIIEKKDKKNNEDDNIPKIFKILPGNWDTKKKRFNNWQADAFVRWKVEIPSTSQIDVWSDWELWKSWENYYIQSKQERSLCYVTGMETSIADQHPAKVRNDGDKAKIISSNDSSGFTFRGRFISAEQAAGVSYEVSQKAHSALRWLVDRQGYKKGDQAIVAWSVQGSETPDPFADPLTLLGEDELPIVGSGIVYTAQDLALKLKKKIAGYNQKLENTDNIIVMGLDSATPGRLAITFYRELTGSDFLNRLEIWHEKCAWFHDYAIREVEDVKTGKKKKVHYWFTGAPAPDDIAQAAYGTRLDDKLRKSVVERLLSCIIDGQQVPFDLVATLRNRACNRVGIENWEWKKVLSISCALYRKYYEKEGFDMALEESRSTRDYLYGRLLALADTMEQWALNKAGEGRQTMAARLMQRFADHPASTWRTIELALIPYKARLGGKSIKRQRIIDEVKDKFISVDDYNSDKPLSGEFLLAYSCQKEKLRQDALLYKKQLEEKKAKGQVTQDVIDLEDEDIESI